MLIINHQLLSLNFFFFFFFFFLLLPSSLFVTIIIMIIYIYKKNQLKRSLNVNRFTSPSFLRQPLSTRRSVTNKQAINTNESDITDVWRHWWVDANFLLICFANIIKSASHHHHHYFFTISKCLCEFVLLSGHHERVCVRVKGQHLFWRSKIYSSNNNNN